MLVIFLIAESFQCPMSPITHSVRCMFTPIASSCRMWCIYVRTYTRIFLLPAAIYQITSTSRLLAPDMCSVLPPLHEACPLCSELSGAGNVIPVLLLVFGLLKSDAGSHAYHQVSSVGTTFVHQKESPNQRKGVVMASSCC